MTRRRQIKETLTAHLVAWRELDERPPSSGSETLSNCRNSLVYCPDQCSSSLWWLKLSVIGSDRRFLADFRGQVVDDSRLPPSSGHLLRRGRDRAYCEGIPPAGRACAPRKGSYISPCTYYSTRRWGHVPSPLKKGRLGLERGLGGGSGVSAEGASNIAKYSASPPLKQD